MRRVAFAVPGDLSTPTGGYAYDRRMIVELQHLEWQVDVVDLGDGFPHPNDAQRRGAESRLVEIAEGCPVIVDGLALGVLPQAAERVSQTHPLIALVHHPLALESGLPPSRADELRVSERTALAAAKAVIVTSPATARLLVADYGVPESRIAVAVPGNDPRSAGQGSSGGIVRLLAVGAIVPRKGFDVLVAALAALPDLAWHLTIAGDRNRDPRCAKALDDAIARAGLNGRVDVWGAVPDDRLAAFYAAADVFTLPSRFEGYGMAFSEAIAHGLPVIGTSAGAIPDTVPKEASLLVPPDDVAALTSALRRVITDADERRRMAAGARDAAKNLPTWQNSAKIFSAAVEAAS